MVRLQSPVTEGNFNIYKSNSIYITNLDISRVYLSRFLVVPILLSIKSLVYYNLIVSVTLYMFYQEIKLFRTYKFWIRVSSWDNK